MKASVKLGPHASSMDKLYALADALNIRFSHKSTGPFEIMNRLTEEIGEIATQVNVMEDNGIKRFKASPSKEKLASEVRDAMQVLLQIVRYYGIERELLVAIDGDIEKGFSKGLIQIESAKGEIR